jgi:molybdopterin/thiamine biosynthesis adenylyltransferase
MKDKLIQELFKIRYPHIPPTSRLLNDLKKKVTSVTKKDISINGLSKKAIFELTTARNRNLIKPDQQYSLHTYPVGFFGMSVGSHAALSWMLLSRAKHIKIVDPDTIDASNLNRLRFGWSVVGKFKTDVVKEQLIDMYPDAVVYATKKTDEASVRAVFDENIKIEAVVDEIDNIPDKILLRKLARERRIPLISAADVGDNVMVDVERYDLDPKYPFFHGREKKLESLEVAKLSEQELKRLIINLVGFEHNSEQMINSLFGIGASIPTWPQLGSTATIAGGIVATLLKKIRLGEKVESGRYYVSLDDIFVSDFNSESMKEGRERKISHIKKMLKI